MTFSYLTDRHSRFTKNIAPLGYPAVHEGKISRCKATVDDFSYSPRVKIYPLNDPKYTVPRNQIDPSTEIPPTNEDGTVITAKAGIDGFDLGHLKQNAQLSLLNSALAWPLQKPFVTHCK